MHFNPIIRRGFDQRLYTGSQSPDADLPKICQIDHGH